MTAFLLYIARSGLYLGVFYAFYLLVMRRTTFFRFNRLALQAGSVLCALLPLLRVGSTSFQAVAGPLSIVAVGENTAATTATSFSWVQVIGLLYGLGALVVIGLTLLSIGKILRLAGSGERTRLEGFSVVLMKDNQPSFTFGRTIFIGREDLERNPVIFTHETMHVKSRHWLDLLLFRILQTVWWWNPLVWIARTELGLLHEYEADEGVLNKGIDATQYQLLLVRKAVGEQRFSLASGFQHAHLKNRIAMMLKPSSNGWIRLSYLALIPVLAAFVLACNPSKNQKTPEPAAAEDALETKAAGYEVTVTDEPAPETESVNYQLVDVKPTFRGGDANEFSRWVNANLVYPESAKAAGTQGRILLQFTIDTDGSMTDIKVVKSLDPALDAESLRVLNSCTEKWTPGLQDGKPVPVTFNFPIVFQLR